MLKIPYIIEWESLDDMMKGVIQKTNQNSQCLIILLDFKENKRISGLNVLNEMLHISASYGIALKFNQYSNKFKLVK